MKITLIAVGKLKESYLKEGVDLLSKELQKHCKFQIIEIKDEKTDEKNSESQDLQIKKREGALILKQLPSDSYVIPLAIDGKGLSSPELKNALQKISPSGNPHICFIIGGSLGLSSEVLAKANLSLSFSPMTFPHQLMRLILMEQLLTVLS